MKPSEIVKLREKKNWTQEQLARVMGFSLRSVQRWESGKAYPLPSAIARLKQLQEDGVSR